MSEIIASTYEVIGKIGSGGGGNVFLAYHLRLGKKVVLKADKRKITASPELLRREVDILKELSHSYIPNVYDFFVENDTVYTVMDYIEGESLDKPLKRGETYSQAQVIKWAKQLLEALSYLHSPIHGTPPKGFVHSDIKPANLMRTPNNDICLIDFNIALALGEENVIGCSAGYASPEHYGLDFSSKSDTESADSDRTSVAEETDVDKAVILDEERTEVSDKESDSISGKHSEGMSSSKSTATPFSRKVIIPDVRSDIYSTGATLYHLLKGQRPDKDATQVIPLSQEEFSPLLVKIISKAMNPNPDLRYQTAEEMLYDFSHLHENDPRLKKWKWQRRIAGTLFSLFLAAGTFSTFIGLKRMQTTESWLKLTEYSKDAAAKGDSKTAINYALQALPEETNIWKPDYAAETQRTLTDALKVYDLADGYKTHKTIEFPAAPLSISIAPDGKTAACMYAYSVAVFDTESAQVIAEFPAIESALAEVKYLDENIIAYAAREGLKVYDIRNEKELWTGKPATSISISEDKTRIAAIYKEESCAYVYDALDGEMLHTVDFGGRHQQVTVNDSFANPNDNLLALNADGSLLGVSFADGSLEIYNLEVPEENIQIFDETSGYTHFEGGFYQRYFAFAAADEESSVFAVIDTIELNQTGGFESESMFHVQTDSSGIYVQTENLLVNIHPVTGEQTPLVTTAENILCFARSDTHTLITSQEEFQFFDKNANLTAHYEKEYSSNLIQIAGDTALIGSRDSSSVRMMKYESHPEAELFAYDASYVHDEARVSADKNTMMLFRYGQFRLYRKDGTCTKEVEIPNADQVYDQQYIREDGKSYLQVFYNDGTVRTYSAEDGSIVSEDVQEKPDLTLYEEFFTDTLRIESPLHGTPAAYDRKTGKMVRQLQEDAYLTYVTQVGDSIITQYVTADGYCYGQLLNKKCEVLADLPYLCDIVEETLIFDYPTGNLRASHIYDIKELVEMAQKITVGGK